jgi:hypothetical protein
MVLVTTVVVVAGGHGMLSEVLSRPAPKAKPAVLIYLRTATTRAMDVAKVLVVIGQPAKMM